MGWGVSASGSNDHHRGWGHGVGGREGAVRRESGARMVATSTGPAGVRKVGQWVESPRGLKSRDRVPLRPHPGDPPLPWEASAPLPILLGLPGGQAPLRPGALSGMSDVKDEAHPVERPPRRVYTTCGRANTRQADPKETERTASGGGSYSRGADISTTCTEWGAEINQEQTLVRRPGLGPKNLSKPGSF